MQSEKLYKPLVPLGYENKLCVIGLSSVTSWDVIGGRLCYISVSLQSHLLASGISSQLLHLQGRREHKPSEYFTVSSWIYLHYHHTHNLYLSHTHGGVVLVVEPVFLGEPWSVTVCSGLTPCQLSSLLSLLSAVCLRGLSKLTCS